MGRFGQDESEGEKWLQKMKSEGEKEKEEKVKEREKGRPKSTKLNTPPS